MRGAVVSNVHIWGGLHYSGLFSAYRCYMQSQRLRVRIRFFFLHRIVLQLDVALTDMSDTPFASSPHGGVAQGHAAAIDET